MSRKPPFRDGQVHVCKKMCKTCIFRPGNLMRLEPGRVKQMVTSSLKTDSAIICHSTLYGEDPRGEAICRGFFDRYKTIPLQLAERLNKLKEQ